VVQTADTESKAEEWHRQNEKLHTAPLRPVAKVAQKAQCQVASKDKQQHA